MKVKVIAAAALLAALCACSSDEVTYSAAEYDALSDELAGLQEELETTKAELEAGEKLIYELEGQIEELEGAVTDGEGELLAAEERYDSLLSTQTESLISDFALAGLEGLCARLGDVECFAGGSGTAVVLVPIEGRGSAEIQAAWEVFREFAADLALSHGVTSCEVFHFVYADTDGETVMEISVDCRGSSAEISAAAAADCAEAVFALE